MSESKTDIPDTPPEVAARQAASRGLTRETVDLLSSDSSSGVAKVVLFGDEAAVAAGRARRVDPAARAAAEKAEKYAGPEPLRGLTPAQITAIKSVNHPGLPKMSPTFGDRTPDFLNAFWAKLPWYAAVHYAYRPGTWPTKLPAVWPPKRPTDWLTSLDMSAGGPQADPAMAKLLVGTKTAPAAAAPEQVMVVDGEHIRPARADDIIVVEPGKPPRVATAEDIAARTKAKPAPRKRTAAPKTSAPTTSPTS